MKNIITVDYDSERKESIKIAKPEDLKVADDDKEAYHEMIMDDMATLSKGLATLIRAANKDGIMEEGKALENCVKIIKDNMEVPEAREEDPAMSETSAKDGDTVDN